MSRYIPRGFTHPVFLSKGGFASIYRVRQQRLERSVVIKIIEEKQKDVRTKLLEEARTHAELNLSSVPKIFDCFEKEDRLYIVMEWLHGISLRELMEQGIEADLCPALVVAIAQCCNQLHQAGFAHRDIKPENIFVGKSCQIRLIDFGLTKKVDEVAYETASVVRGTPGYMAPELWEIGPKADPIKTDLYALGKVFKELLGQSRFAALEPILQAADFSPNNRQDNAQELLDQLLAHDAFAYYATESHKQLALEQAEHMANSSFADKLITSSRRLLQSRRREEAYWLCAEAIRLNPEHSEALNLMQRFPAITQQQKRVRNLQLLVAIAFFCFSVSVLVTLYFVRSSPLVSSMQKSLFSRQSLLGNSRFQFSSSELMDQSPVTALKRSKMLRLPQLSQQHIVGRVRIEKRPLEGELFINDVAVAPAPKGIYTLTPGTYKLSWVAPNGSQRWFEYIDLLAFQDLALEIRVR